MIKEETKFSRRLSAVLKTQGAWIFNSHGHLMQKAGIPDLLVIHKKWCGFIELKVGDNKPSAIQKKIAQKISDRDFPVFILRQQGDMLLLENFDGRCFMAYRGIEDTLSTLISSLNWEVYL